MYIIVLSEAYRPRGKKKLRKQNSGYSVILKGSNCISPYDKDLCCILCQQLVTWVPVHSMCHYFPNQICLSALPFMGNAT